MRSLIAFLAPAAFIFVFFSSVCAQQTYWVDKSCDITHADGTKFTDAIKEVIWVAGRVADAIEAQDDRLEQSFMWFFYFSVRDRYADKVKDTFRRISQLKEEPSGINKNANLRLYCDNDDRYKLQPGGHYMDENNESISGRSMLLCWPQPQKDGKDVFYYAHTMYDIDNLWNFVNTGQKSSQLPDRTTISFCNRMFTYPGPLKERPFTVRAFAAKELDKLLTQLPKVSPLAFHTILHEFVHVPFLSEQTMTEARDEDNTNVPVHYQNGIDSFRLHPTDTKDTSGYYTGPLPGPTLGDPKFVIMNPDSYAYVGFLFRIRDKQWVPYSDGATPPLIRLKKDTSLELVGDWPGAPTPTPSPNVKQTPPRRVRRDV
ncbi:uncharacterized protein BDZ99DRAFT_474985 [Mytilinidion resinicola]|uniref:Zincin n=1 Tax=Mytilinidion resinicola TaxID=574789 RepID=A0A6A6YRM4_9PEZI|nr:uncharacterized protein BDZ99DRAFT_474985 [Mytilinidion resinicola]KAF2811421.1 hypothetical protein BDZ99DRAFT_474985 [Mytilinidion resinicola]